MFYSMANVDDFVGLGDLGLWSVQTPYGTLSPTKKVSLTNCQDLFARAQENFNLAAKHDNNFATYNKNMNLRYNQYQQCANNSGQPVYPIDTTADPSAVMGGSAVPVAPPPSALQYATAVAGGVLAPPGTVPTPTAIQAQQAAASMVYQQQPDSGGSFFSGNTLITLGLGVAALAALIVLMKKSYPSSSASIPGVKV